MLPQRDVESPFVYVDDNPHHVKQSEELRMAAEGRGLPRRSDLGLPLRLLRWWTPIELEDALRRA